MFVSDSDDRGRTWSAPTTLRAEGLNVAPRVAASRSGLTAVAWYGANATGEPEDVPEGTSWHVDVASRAPGAASWQVAEAGAVRAGPLCLRLQNCTAIGGQYDWLGAGIGPGERVSVAYVAEDAAMTQSPTKQHVMFVAGP